VSIYRRKSGRWAVLIDLDRDANGKRQRRPLGTFQTRREAARAEREALAARDRGVDLSPGRVTVRELIERYLDLSRRKGLSPATLERYEELARLHVLPVVGELPLAKLGPAHVSEVYARAHRNGLSAKTIRQVAAVLGAAVRWAVGKDLVVRNVVERASDDLPKVRRSPARALTAEEVTALLGVADGTPWRTFFLVAVCTGARRSEIAALRWQNVDMERASITIMESLCATRRGVEVKGTKTDTVRVVALSSAALAVLRAQRAEQARARLLAGTAYENRDLVFADALGRPWHPRAISNAFARLASKAKLSHVRLHDLRHTAATWLLQSGVDVRTVASVLGHANAITTLGTYAHVMPGAQARAVERIAERLAAGNS
jgi:integrase